MAYKLINEDNGKILDYTVSAFRHSLNWRLDEFIEYKMGEIKTHVVKSSFFVEVTPRNGDFLITQGNDGKYNLYEISDIIEPLGEGVGYLIQATFTYCGYAERVNGIWIKNIIPGYGIETPEPIFKDKRVLDWVPLIILPISLPFYIYEWCVYEGNDIYDSLLEYLWYCYTKEVKNNGYA